MAMELLKCMYELDIIYSSMLYLPVTEEPGRGTNDVVLPPAHSEQALTATDCCSSSVMTNRLSKTQICLCGLWCRSVSSLQTSFQSKKVVNEKKKVLFSHNVIFNMCCLLFNVDFQFAFHPPHSQTQSVAQCDRSLGARLSGVYKSFPNTTARINTGQMFSEFKVPGPSQAPPWCVLSSSRVIRVKGLCPDSVQTLSRLCPHRDTRSKPARMTMKMW
ncbi:hypothetical protein JOB18_047201 [Solea senegalensis]|uniref:Uncharacterized protein n=1 Tax=Solea senegalensis TaxID=28829 RepID=A0AAV6TBR4_SOLSE|nr:hypothetical protein JOB18_047201 [Solea senegalensis]